MKAVVDSSVLVSAFLTRANTAGAFVRAGLDDRFEIYLSHQILAEVDRNLRRPKLMRRYRYAEREVSAFLDELTAGGRLAVDLPSIDPVSRDPNDDHVLAAALACGADSIVTGDQDLLVLGQWRGI